MTKSSKVPSAHHDWGPVAVRGGRCTLQPTADSRPMASPQPTPPPIVAPPLPGAPAAREVVFDEAGRIAEDLPCLRCGYNLRGLGSEAACPECASAVGQSIQGDLLRFCDPVWRNKRGS